MKKRVKILSVILGISLLASSCGTLFSNGNDSIFTSAPSTEEDIKKKLDVIKPEIYHTITGLTLEPGSYISVIGRSSDDSYWSEVERGALQAVKDLNEALGYSGKDKIELAFCSPKVKNDIDDQVSLFDEELARYPAAICLAAIDETAFEVQFDLAADSKIPIVTFDSGTIFQNASAHVATDNYGAAQEAAEQFASLTGNTGKVVIFVSDSRSMSAKQREQGFQDWLTEHAPDIQIADTYYFDDLHTYKLDMLKTMHPDASDEELLEKAADFSQKDVIQTILKTHPDLTGIYTTNLNTTRAAAAVLSELQREDLCLVGFDGIEGQLELLESGVVDGLILQNPYGMGYAAVVAAVRSRTTAITEPLINTGHVWVSKETYDSEAVQALLY